MQIRVCKAKKKGWKMSRINKRSKDGNEEKRITVKKKLNVKTVNQARGQKEYSRGEILLSTGIAILNWIVV